MYSKGKSAVTAYLVVYCRKNRLNVNRIGYTVSVKLGHAVVRNRIRRQLREICRTNASKLVTGRDIVLVARSKCINGDYWKMEVAFLDACKELGLTEASGGSK